MPPSKTQRTLAWRRLALAAGVASLGATPLLPKSQPEQQEIQAYIKRFCMPCHDSDEARGGIDLSRDATPAQMKAHPEVWKDVLRQLNSSRMPPKRASAQPNETERKEFARLVARLFESGDSSGHVTLRRLNRAEYDNTVRDLFGISFAPAANFPSDDVGNGFDNIGEVLSVSPLLAEKYLQAAEAVAAQVVQVSQTTTRHWQGTDLPFAQYRDGGLAFYTNSVAEKTYQAPDYGNYRIRVQAYADQAGPDLAECVLLVDGKTIKLAQISAKSADEPQFVDVFVQLDPGTHKIGVGFTNDFYNPDDPNPKNRDRNLYVNFIEVLEPATKKISEAHKRLFTPAQGLPFSRQPEAILRPFLTRAYRRPPSDREIARMVGLVSDCQKRGEPLERGIQLAVTAALASPNFLFRPEPARSGRLLNGYELASRLSYFLWSSLPDERLLQLAESGELVRPEILEQESKRMLRDPKAAALGDCFAAQWLGLRKLDIVRPDPKLFPNINQTLRNDLRTETLTFFNQLVKEDGGLEAFLNADYTYLNGRLAEFYGFGPTNSDEFQKTPLPDRRRGGILNQAGVMMLTSNPNRTSPVKRGKWILENILGTPPPPPPPNVGVLADDKDAVIAHSIKDRLKAHVKNPACAACHLKLDPLGLAQENFDAVGRWRESDGSMPVEPKSTLAEGEEIDGPEGLRNYLLGKKDLFANNFCEKLMTFALGRGLTPSDAPEIERIARESKQNGYKVRSILLQIVKSRLFLNQGADKQG